MNERSLRSKSGRGFTLIEVIVSIIVAGILGSFLLVFLGTNITQSGLPVHMVKDQYRINQAMEEIIADYKNRIKNDTLNLGTFPADIEAAGYCGTDDVDLSTSYVSYSDPDGDKTFTESTCSYGTGCKNLKVTLTKGYQKVTTILTE